MSRESYSENIQYPQDIITGITKENKIPLKMPVTSEAAPNIPAIDAYCGSTILKMKQKKNVIYNKRLLQLNCFILEICSLT